MIAILGCSTNLHVILCIGSVEKLKLLLHIMSRKHDKSIVNLSQTSINYRDLVVIQFINTYDCPSKAECQRFIRVSWMPKTQM